MGVKLLAPPMLNGRFEFVFYIDQSADGSMVFGRGEIFEFGERRAVLEVRESRLSRLEVADVLLARCVKWADVRSGVNVRKTACKDETSCPSESFSNLPPSELS